MKLSIQCDWYGKPIIRYSSRIKPHNFCSRLCLANFSSKEKNPEHYMDLKDYTNISQNMRGLNLQLNPTRMTDTTKEKIRKAHLNSGEGKTYAKNYGRHEHRVVAELLLERSLMPGEVVHHIDGNKRNNDVNNIRVYKSQSEHAKFHAEFNWFLTEIKKLEQEEVTEKNDIYTT